MTFSRFFNHSFLFFLLCFIANLAKPIGLVDSAYSYGQPLSYEIPRIPQAIQSGYTAILSDKDNRLFITTDHEVFIYDGVNYQKFEVNGNPTIAYDGNDKIVIGGYNYLALLTQNTNGGYSKRVLIDPLSNAFYHQITSIGFDNSKDIYFSTGTKLWKFDKQPTLVDSAEQIITIHSFSNGIVYYNNIKGFYRLNGIGSKAFDYLNSFSNRNERVLRVIFAGSYLFATTSDNRLLMFDNQGKLIKIISDIGGYNSDLPIDICTSNNIDFFAITPSQIFRFVNPIMVEFFNHNDNIRGVIRSVRELNGKLFIATSFGLYFVKDFKTQNAFTLLQQGDFNEICIWDNHIFAIGTDGLYHISDYRVEKIRHEYGAFNKSITIESKPPEAFFINNKGVYSAKLNKPFLIQKLNFDKNQRFINFYTSGNTLILRTSSDNWFEYDPKTNNIITINNLNSNTSNTLFSIKKDTFSLINDKLFNKDSLGYKIKVGMTYSGQTIFTPIRGFHPKFLSFYIDHGTDPISNKVANLSIENKITVNEVYLDSDSTTWISTNRGLIKILSCFTKRLKESQPSLIVFSTNNNSGFIQSTNSSSSNYRVKQGKSFVINLSGLSTSAWNNIMYSYKNEENPVWSDWTPNSRIILKNLEPGHQEYLFKCRDVNGFESPEIRLSLTIIPGFFHTQFNLVAIIVLILLILYTVSRWRIFYFAQERYKLESIINRRTEELVKEKEKTDNLLARVLPRDTATELKETGKASTQKFNLATVLFSDIQGFTKITDELNPENLIDQLDKFFLYFDSVVDKYRIEKIKTIGDAYMCAGGIPHKNRTNPVEVVLAALEMLHFMREINLEHNPGQDIWDLRIGIDTGPVIAGVVGRNKLSYDIWGTTVNTASRMESSGEVGRINISGNTHIFVHEYFLCTYRGKMPIKNKGDIEMYFVDGIKPALSNNLDLYRPNMEFQIQLQFLRFGDLEEFILEKLEKGLPKNLYYHNLKHTVDVYTQVELIGRSEDVNLEEQLILQTAALFHDAGHLIDYDTHEEMGVKLAREILPEYQYSERQIQIVSELIMVTKLPPKPKNLLEAIMCDADLDYLGRTDFIPVSNMLYKELHEHGRIGTIQEWNELQIKFIEKHQYFTNTARKLRNVNKNSQLENIKSWIEKNKL